MGGEYFRLRYAYAVLFALLAAELLIGAASSYYLGTGDARAFNKWAAGLLLLVWLAWVPLWAVISLKPAPSRYILDTYRRNAAWFALASALFVFAWLKTVNVATIKNAIPHIVPFYADPMLADLDRLLFFGIDPWRITHALVGRSGTRFVDAIYALWHPVQIGFGIWLILTRNAGLQLRGLLSYSLCWLILGGAFAIGLSSVGPIFYEQFYGSDRFAELVDNLAAPMTHSAATFLLDNYNTGTVGTGISAFPSLHVAVVTWEVLILRHAFARRWPAVLATVWAFAIFFGSVHLGWHYAADGIFAALGAVLIWRLSGCIVKSLDGGSFMSAGRPQPAE